MFCVTVINVLLTTVENKLKFRNKINRNSTLWEGEANSRYILTMASKVGLITLGDNTLAITLWR